MPRAHSPERRRAVLNDVPALGISGAAKKHGISKGTVHSWAEAAGISRTVRNEQTAAATEAAKLAWHQRRAVMVDQIGQAADMALTETIVALGSGNPRNAKDAATTMAILVDKAQLLSGSVTDRRELHGDREEVLADARNRAVRLVS